jgi:hypothetical protein
MERIEPLFAAGFCPAALFPPPAPLSLPPSGLLCTLIEDTKRGTSATRYAKTSVYVTLAGETYDITSNYIISHHRARVKKGEVK